MAKKDTTNRPSIALPTRTRVLKAISKLLFPKKIWLRDTHATLVKKLSLDDAVFAHNQITYGYFAGIIPTWQHAVTFRPTGPDPAYEQVEIATSLYGYIMRRWGTPLTPGQTVRYRRGLKRTVGKILRHRTRDLHKRTRHAEKLLAPYLLEFSEVAVTEESNLDDVLFDMNQACRVAASKRRF